MLARVRNPKRKGKMTSERSGSLLDRTSINSLSVRTVPRPHPRAVVMTIQLEIFRRRNLWTCFAFSVGGGGGSVEVIFSLMALLGMNMHLRGMFFRENPHGFIGTDKLVS